MKGTKVEALYGTLGVRLRGTKWNPRLEALNGTPMVGGTRWYPRLEAPNGTPKVRGT